MTMNILNNDRTIDETTDILATVYSSHYTRNWLEISVQLPDEPGIDGAYLLYRPVDTDCWTIAGEISGQPGELVTIRVIDLQDGVYQVAAKLYDKAGNISDVKEPFDTVVVDRTPPDGAHADVVVPDRNADNMSSMNEPSNKWSVVNMVMRCIVPFGAVYLCGRCCVKP